MALDAKITKQLDPNYVQVDITNKNEPYRYFKVPRQNADSFIKKFKKENKNNRYITNIGFAASIFGGLFITSLATKNINKPTTKHILNVLGSIATALATMFASEKYIEKKDSEYIKKYHAEEIFYEI